MQQVETHPGVVYPRAEPEGAGVRNDGDIPSAVRHQSSPVLEDSLVMMIDDDAINLEVSQVYLAEGGYRRFLATEDSSKAVELMAERQPDVVLLDLMMPLVSGLDILRVRLEDPRLEHIPVIVLTASTDAATKLRALELGATDFLHKPVDASELILRLKNTLSAKAYEDQLANYSAELERQVRIRSEQLESAHQQIIRCLVRAAEFRDDDSGQHAIRVGRYAATLARQLGCDELFASQIRFAAQLHDLGKIGVPENILRKPGRLDPQEFLMIRKHCDLDSIAQSMERESIEEWQTVARHTGIGAAIMGIPDIPVMKMAATIAETHHERWDGSGYPRGLVGEEIPLEGRITAVADAYDALCNRRPYKDFIPEEACFRVLLEEQGKQFDPRIIDAFLGAIDEILQTQVRFKEP